MLTFILVSIMILFFLIGIVFAVEDDFESACVCAGAGLLTVLPLLVEL